MNKKISLFLFGFLLLVAAAVSVDAALCKGFDGYYHDCGYTYGHNSYGKGHHYNYGHHDRVVYLGGSNYKKYNPINDYYIYSGPGYDRTRYDSRVRYVRGDRYHRDYDRDHKVIYIRDERTYEHRPAIREGDKAFRVYIDHHEPSEKIYVNHENKNYLNDDYAISKDKYHSNPYHDYHHNQNIRSWKIEHEEHCPYGFSCVTSDWH